jgi:PAS domain S-box-containing protein
MRTPSSALTEDPGKPAAPQASPPAPAVPPEVADILMVDDRPDTLLAIEAILEPLNQNLVRASSGEEALRKLLERDFAVILLDVQLPRMNGFETARLIKARERSKHIPIIFLTAINKDEAYVFEGYSVGAVDYISKPFQPEILRSKVAAFVDLYLRQRKVAEQEALLRESEKRDIELRFARDLLDSDARFREIMTSAMDAIILFDAEGRITLFNDAAERMFCCAASEAISEPINRFFPDGNTIDRLRSAASAMHLSSASTNGTAAREVEPSPAVASLNACRSTGEAFPIEASITHLETKRGGVYTLIVRDVSERVRREERLREQAISLAQSTAELKALNEELSERQLQLERALSARNRFYASMSHELRTPINAVLGYSTLLLENIYGPLNDKQQEGIARTHKAARHLLELVNDVLDLSKIEAGKMDVRFQPVSIPAVIDDLLVTVRPLADAHRSPLRIEPQASDEPLVIVSDPRRLRQILLNLISNAIKFGKEKPIRVTYGRRPDGGVLIEVIDQGDGISPVDQERIFQEFVQLGKTQLTEGTGLGLPISRRLAELLQGSLTLESRAGQGCTFRLSLPRSAEPRTSGGRAMPVETLERAALEQGEPLRTGGESGRL